jgi:CheY-like chemotaxis protein
VLLDIIMPGMSGVEALERLREMDPEARVFMVTAVDQDHINRRLMLMGAAGIIYKPFSTGDFERAFHSHGFAPAAQEKKPAPAEDDVITRLAAGGLSKCMLRTGDDSSWAWELCDIRAFSGRISDAAALLDFGRSSAAVQINIREGGPYVSAMIFRGEDIGLISKCMGKGPLYDTAGIVSLDESMLLEIGNIILNALSNPLFNSLKTIAIPSVPILIKGGRGSVAAGFSSCLDPKLDLRIIAAELAMRSEGRTARARVVAILPEELAVLVQRTAADS